MKRILPILLLGTLLQWTAQAADGPPTEASLHKLLDTMNASKLIDGMWAQMDGMMKAAVQQASAGRPLNDAQKAIADDMVTQIAAVYRETMSWEKFEPVMLRAYQKSLTQSEVDGMTAFYASPAGRAVIQKLPLIMQNSMQEMQGMMKEFMPRIQAIERDAADRIRKAAAPATPGP